jgi:hypothetical protein
LGKMYQYWTGADSFPCHYSLNNTVWQVFCSINSVLGL